MTCKIKGCDREESWHVWFKGCGGVYTSYCTEHMALAVNRGVDGYPVTQVGHILLGVYIAVQHGRFWPDESSEPMEEKWSPAEMIQRALDSADPPIDVRVADFEGKLSGTQKVEFTQFLPDAPKGVLVLTEQIAFGRKTNVYEANQAGRTSIILADNFELATRVLVESGRYTNSQNNEFPPYNVPEREIMVRWTGQTFIDRTGFIDRNGFGERKGVSGD